jgi:hypothetical protein
VFFLGAPSSELSLSPEACFSPTQEEAHVTADMIVFFVSLPTSYLVMTKHVTVVDFLSLETSSLVMTEHVTVVDFLSLETSSLVMTEHIMIVFLIEILGNPELYYN